MDTARVAVEDLGSRNGTYVEGRLIRSVRMDVSVPTVLHVGPFTLTVRHPGEPIARTLPMRRSERVSTLSEPADALSPPAQLAPSASVMERRLVELLQEHHPHPVPTNEIGQFLWGDAGWTPYMLHNLVSRCRKDLLPGVGHVPTIVSVRGFGYRLELGSGTDLALAVASDTADGAGTIEAPQDTLELGG